MLDIHGDYQNYVIEVGNQICIMPDGTTGNKESELHLKTFSDSDVRFLYAKSLRIVSIIDRKLSDTESDLDRISLLSTQIGELAKMISISTSVGLHGLKSKN